MANPPDEPRPDPTPEVDVGMEEPTNDVLEQHRTDTDQEELDVEGASTRPIEADAADVDEQRRGVPDEDDEWREA
jgi:hypothetical protein